MSISYICYIPLAENFIAGWQLNENIKNKLSNKKTFKNTSEFRSHRILI